MKCNFRQRRIPTCLQILTIFLLVAFRTAFAACPTNTMSSPPRWSFTTLEWVYSGSLSSTQVGLGAATWNSRQSFTVVYQGSGSYLDLNITDTNSLNALGEIVIWNQAGGSPCYLKRSLNCSSVCYNQSRIYYADVRLSPNNIGGAGSDWASYWGLSTSDATNLVTKMTVAHEVGHFFGLADQYSSANCTDPTIMSTNDQFYCQLSGGATSCDGTNVGSVYSGWSTVSFVGCGQCLTTSSCSN